ncbi:hypothetical protein [uncultured Brachyspira sp.]|nr:hypothetical protein [uncultured Brachyspira sp.]
MTIPKIWATPRGGLRQMQSFWFFVPTKELGVWGLVPTNTKI